MGPCQIGKETRVLWDSAKILPGEMGEPEGGKHRTKETANMLRVQNQLPVGRSHEKPREEGPQGTQTSENERVKEQELRRRHRGNVPDVQEELRKPKDNEATYEDGTRSDTRVTDMLWMREEVPNQVDTTGTPENKLQWRKELRENKGG